METEPPVVVAVIVCYFFLPFDFHLFTVSTQLNTPAAFDELNGGVGRRGRR